MKELLALSKDENDQQDTPKLVSRANNNDSEKPIELQPEYGKYIYGEIIRDFPDMIDYLGRLKFSATSTCIDLLALAQSLRVRINYSSDLDKDFMLYQPKTEAMNRHNVEAVLVVTDKQMTYQNQAWFVAQGLATYILDFAEYIPDFSENKDAMNKWTVFKLAEALLLPNDLVERVVDLSMALNEKTLDKVDQQNHFLVFNAPRTSIITHTAAQLANVPEWLMSQRIEEFYNG
ncbi:hypothetical protein IV84_GL002072 [Pediococcus damnosus]|nr:hypothetical protein IV84_GL002072 [Pediococcus damnosus]